MIRSYFGLDNNPFSHDEIKLLPQQQEIFDTIKVHSQQGGLCLLIGEPGTGKSVIKEAILKHNPKQMIAPVVNRTLHTYFSTLRILCNAFQIDADGANFKCEKRLIEQAEKINRQGKMLVPIIDDAHLMDTNSLRRLRLLFEDFPKNHNLVLIAHPEMMIKLSLSVNEDIRSRVTYSVQIPKLNPDDTKSFILRELDRVALSHNTFTENALDLIVRSSEGVLRLAKNLCIGTLIEAVRDHTKTVDLKQVNKVLMQPHWRRQNEVV